MRASGILMPVFSLPGPYGIGTLGREAYRFVDFLSQAKQTFWQILPIAPPAMGTVPIRVFPPLQGILFHRLRPAGPAGISGGIRTAPGPAGGAHPVQRAVPPAPADSGQSCPAAAGRPHRRVPAVLPGTVLLAEDYALFMAIKEEQGQAGLAHWPDPLRCRQPDAIADARERLAGRCGYYKAVQYFFYQQWQDLKAYANHKGIQLIGDIPIYVSPDSSDLWTRPELFQTDGQVHLTRVAGCPPDSFAADGQLWGNPLYDWPRHAAEDFAWWKQRLRHATSIYNLVRIDHFRGFESYFSIPAGDTTAHGGQWVKGPGLAFIHAMHQAVGRDAVIAEDLGYLTDEVKALLAASGCPGMKIMQFAFDSREPGNYLPYTYTPNSVVYTGTHDNVTTQGWQQTASPQDIQYACRYLRCTPEGLTDAMICACLSSVSSMAVIPMADWLHLGPEARINTPSTLGSNWQWRLDPCLLTSQLAQTIAELTSLYDRAPIQT